MAGRIATWALVAAVLLAGCGGAGVRDNRKTFRKGYKAYKHQEWQTAVDRFTEFLRTEPASPHRGEVYYWRGLTLLHLERRDEARADFDRALRSRPHPSIASLANVALGNLHFEDGRDTDALLAYDRALMDPAPEVPVERVLLRMAISLQRLGKWRRADRYLACVVERYPKTAVAEEARRRYRARGFNIQTGAYASRDGARREAARLSRAGFRPEIGTTTSRKRSLHTVRVGGARTFAEAQALAHRVSQAGFTAMVVP